MILNGVSRVLAECRSLVDQHAGQHIRRQSADVATECRSTYLSMSTMSTDTLSPDVVIDTVGQVSADISINTQLACPPWIDEYLVGSIG